MSDLTFEERLEQIVNETVVGFLLREDSRIKKLQEEYFSILSDMQELKSYKKENVEKYFIMGLITYGLTEDDIINILRGYKNEKK